MKNNNASKSVLKVVVFAFPTLPENVYLSKVPRRRTVNGRNNIY
jgi:hypothetical protein